MRLTLDYSRFGFYYPETYLDKVICLTAWLFEPESLSMPELVRTLRLSPQSLLSTLNELADYYQLEWKGNRPYIEKQHVIKEHELHQMVKLLIDENQSYTITQLAHFLNTKDNVIRYYLRTLEKFMDVEYDQKGRPFIL